MKMNKTLLLCASAIMAGAHTQVFAQDNENRIGVYYTIDAGVSPAFMMSKNTVNENSIEVNNMFGYNGRFGLYLTDNKRTDAGLFVGIGVYENKSQSRKNALSSAYTGRFGFTTNTMMHKKGNHRLYWTQDAGASYNRFSYDEKRTPDMPEKKWGVFIEEAVRYSYVLSSGVSVGFKCFVTAAVPIGKTDEKAAFKPTELTEIGIAFTIAM